MKGTLPAILVCAVGASLLVAVPALAGGCDAYCDDAVGCSGSCSIDQDNCAVICIEGGCSVDCYTAPRSCGGGGRLDCYREPPTNSPSTGQQSWAEAPERGWALLRYELRPDAPVVSDHVLAVRASSEDFAQFARVAEARLENEEVAKLRQDSEKDVLAIALGDGSREVLFVAPRHTCTRLRSTLKKRQLVGQAPSASQTVYFRATTDGTGRIASLDVLYSEATAVETRRVVAFGEENLQVWSRQSPSLPLELFGSLRVTPEGKVGYMLVGGSSLF
jgi:hypothetical protein